MCVCVFGFIGSDGKIAMDESILSMEGDEGREKEKIGIIKVLLELKGKKGKD